VTGRITVVTMLRTSVLALIVVSLVQQHPSDAVATEHDAGSCAAAGLCCQTKNNSCHGVVTSTADSKTSSLLLQDTKMKSGRCFCDSACLDIGDCCDDYQQTCQRA
jgi:hypothetical protein